jgi:tetratricopeptide (TPR) repeat protein
MRIPVGKIEPFLAAGALFVCHAAPAQQAASSEPQSSAAAQQPSQAAPAPVGPAASPQAQSDPTSSSTASAINGFYDKKPQDGTAAQKANEVAEHVKDKAIADDALHLGPLGDEEVKARFEKFLGTSPVPPKQLADYAATVLKIEELLRNRQTFDAWKQLFVLAQYQAIDAGVSRELANRIEAVWNAGQTNVQIQARNQQLEKDARNASRNADLMSDSVRQKEWENARMMRAYENKNQNRPQNNAPNGGVPQVNQTGVAADGPQAPPDPSALMGKLALTDEYLRSLESRARIKVNQLKAEQLLGQVKKEFSDYVTSLYNDGFYTHVVLAADFYRRLFQEGDYPVEMAKQVNSALEKSRNVTSTVDVFEYKMGRGELTAATDRLVEGFLTSSYHPALLSLPRDQKQQIANYVAQLDSMRNLVEARDYGGLEELTKQVKATAKDFDTTKPMALVNAARLEGQLRLGKAKLLAQQGKMDEAMQEFQAAAQAWPANPDLKDKAGVFFDTQDVKSQSLVEFDRLVSEKNYRALFDKQVAFAPAIHGDKAREDAFANALKIIKDAEIASEKANSLLLNGDMVGAWETVELAAQNLPDDQKLNKLRADLSGKSAEFVNAISRAKDAEQKHELGYALTWYVNAQRQYPPSQMANVGIERVSKEILNPKTASL